MSRQDAKNAKESENKSGTLKAREQKEKKTVGNFARIEQHLADDLLFLFL